VSNPAAENQSEVHIVWNDSGRAIFTRLTSQHVGKRLAVIYDGNLLASPRINEPISGGNCHINGRLSKAYAERIAAGIDSNFRATSSSPVADDRAKPVTAPRPLETALIARTDTDVLVQDALLLIRLGKLESARERLNEALKREPNHSGALSFLKLLEQKQADTANRVSGTQDQSTNPEQSSTNASETWLAAAVRRLVRDAELLRDLGKVSEAEAKMNEARTLSSLSKPVTPALVTRTFKLGAGFIDRLLELGVPSPDVDSAVPGGAPQQTEIQSRNFAILKAFTDGLGLHFTEPFAPEQPESTSGRAIFLNDRKGILFVRATLDELEVLDQALQVVNTQPQQVTIEVKFAEITGDTTKALGFDWFLGNTLQSNTPGSGSTPSNELPITTVTGLPTPPTNTNAANVATITGILTDPQFRVVIRALEQRGGVDVLSAPKVTTLSGRQARIEMTEKRAIVIAELGKNTFSRTNISVGPSIDVLPVVSPDGRTIQLELNATVTEFLGYDDPSQLPNQPAGQAVPLPRFRVRQGSTTASMFDGQTVVLSGFPVEEVVITKDKVPLLGNIPILGRLFRNESKQTVKKNLIVMVTPTLIDAAGNRIHPKPDVAPAPAAGSSGVFPGTPPTVQP
jgi:type II secretory pathway component GspD/PulD (secretin)